MTQQIKAGITRILYSVEPDYTTIHHPEEGHWEWR